jgi:NAD(P)-dependent dehydrogenase (short-subunit alcohol dehydrogenase family)
MGDARPVIIITGGSSGIGEAAARELSKDCKVIITGRSDRTVDISEEIGVDFYICDFEDLKDVRRLAYELLENYPKIDILVNNAGLIATKFVPTVDGFEKTFQVNYLAPFLLTSLIIDRLIDSKGGVINNSSAAMRGANLSLDDLQAAEDLYTAYCNTKLLDLMHAVELSRRYEDDGPSAVAFHPGVVETRLDREIKNSGIWETSIAYRYSIRPEDGADTLVWLIHNRDKWQPGGYYIERKLAPVPKLAEDEEALEKVWNETERLLSLT